MNGESSNDIWLLDSGCNNHTTGDKSIFRRIDETVKLKVRLGDDKKVKIKGKGTIIVKTKSSIERYIDDVYYIPGLGHNLLSVRQLVDRDFSVLFDNGACEIKKKSSGMSLIRISMTEKRMFPLKFSQLDDQLALTAQHNDESKLWHLRYGHLYFNGLHLLSKKSMVTGLPSITCLQQICEACVFGSKDAT